MSISNEALQKLVQEIETQAISAQQQISVVKTQIAGKQREIRKNQLTSNEMSTLPSDTKVYEGVGKMFVFSPIPELEKRMDKESTDLKKEVENLGKRLQYLETTHKNSSQHIAQILSSGGRA